ncbi:hypothetical protein N2E09_00380 [Leuconostoc citreum]
MTEIKLENGTGIEVTKQGLLIKGKSIHLKIGDSDIVAVIDDRSNYRKKPGKKSLSKKSAKRNSV